MPGELCERRPIARAQLALDFVHELDVQLEQAAEEGRDEQEVCPTVRERLGARLDVVQPRPEVVHVLAQRGQPFARQAVADEIGNQQPYKRLASPPLLWGTEEEHVREMFGSVAREFEFERHSATIEWDSVDGWADHFLERFGPLVTAREMLGDRFADLRAEIVAAWEARNEAEDGRLILPQEYLLAIVRL